MLLMLTGAGPAQAADEHPDLQGVWGLRMDFSRGPGGMRGDPPPYTAEYDAKYQQTVKLVADGKLDLGGLCTPPGMPLLASAVGQFEIINAPQGRMTVIYEFQSQIRRWRLNAEHPAEVNPTMNGDSVARWEGSTLVVDTVGIKEFAYLDNNAGPRSDKLQVIERISLTDKNTMRIETTVLDPVALTKPWTYSKTFDRVANGELIDYECNENPRNPVNPDGTVGFTFKKTE